MKIQCLCGAKYAFDVTPASAANPVQFVCPSCGVDSSAMVNQLIRQQLGVDQLPSVALPPPAPVEPPPPAPSRLKISASPASGSGHGMPAATPAPSVAAADGPATCPKHPAEAATEQCAVCQKPICPKCLELFGYFCSVFCKNKAATERQVVPEYAGQGVTAQARQLRQINRVVGGVAAVVVLLLGLAAWYKFFLAVPHAVLDLEFADRAMAGQSQTVAPNQLLFLHGGTLARYDLGTKKAVWTRELFTQKDVEQLAGQYSQAQSGGSGFRAGQETLLREAREALDNRYSLLGEGKNVWIAGPATLTHYDWETGDVRQTVRLGVETGEFLAGNGELLMVREATGGVKTVTHINYASGEARTEVFHAVGKLTLADQPDVNIGGGLPSANGKPSQPLDPNKVAKQAQNLTTPARLALPAVLANNLHQQALEQAMQDQDPAQPGHARPTVALETGEFTLVPGPYGYVEYTVKLLEERLMTREAMKAAPSKKVMDGNLTAGAGSSAVNEMLNDMQRANGEDKVIEDQSRYQVTVTRPDAPEVADWTGEVIGEPVVYAQKTVNIVAAGQSVTVLDKNNKKLWDATLTYPVIGGHPAIYGGATSVGEGPCVERGNTLYVIDQAVLTAFDLATGNARWRLPSVGIVGLYFDDQNHIYVNTTTANLDKVKYSRQIDINEAIGTVVMKVDAATGKNLWRVHTGGYVAYVSGCYVYTFQSHDKPVDEMASDLTSGLQKPSYMRLVRLNPQNGNTLWQHDDDHAPVDVRFEQNMIYLVFHKAVQVLKYWTF